MLDRTFVFLDYQNVHGWARRHFWPQVSDPSLGHVDPLRLGQLLTARRRRPSELVQVRVYRGRPVPEHQPRAAAANDRQAEAWQRSGLVHVIRRNLAYPPDWQESGGQQLRPTEKGIDVALAVDLVRLGMERAYDAAIVFSSDKDLLPALETVYDLKLGHVEIAAWRGSARSYRIRFNRPTDAPQMPWCHWVSEPEFRTVEDQTDYTRSGS